MFAPPEGADRRASPRKRAELDKGTGINSIPVRFALIASCFTLLCLMIAYIAIVQLQAGYFPVLAIACFALVLLPSAATFIAARRLSGAIRQLQVSTEAILAGDLSRPLDVDLQCEIGGLADSFRAMVGRLNNNILRMNVLAYTDITTGLPNRTVVTHVLGVMSRSWPEDGWNGKAALLFLDLDGFKRVNDTLGHEAGDELLRMVSERILIEGLMLGRNEIDDCTTSFGELSMTVPRRPVLARFAGDEFVIVIPGQHGQRELEFVARRILSSIAKPFVVRENELSISASIGIARTPIDTGNPEELLYFADLAMYSAKEAGRSRFHFFDEKLKRVAQDRAQIESDLRLALERDELALHFQPKLNTRTLELEGVEALIRWNHPERGMVSPEKFIGIAERCGLMPDLGERVLDLAARQAKAWIDAGNPVPIAVNVSPAQFERPYLVKEVLAALSTYSVPTSMIEIEVTETMVMSDFAGTKYRMEQLREAGVTLSIDDFGNGYSNLAQLSRLPFNLLKIDRALVSDIGVNSKSEAIIAAIIHMAHALGHKVVAEGIETQPQHEFLHKLGCDRVQGHLFGGAMTPGILDEWRRHALPNKGQLSPATVLPIPANG